MISIGVITARREPKLEWFFSSLARQLSGIGGLEIVIVDLFAEAFDDWTEADVHSRREYVFNAAMESDFDSITVWMPAKPTVWSGPHRITKDNWWSKANSLNSFLCAARGGFVACVDDRAVLSQAWFQSVVESEKSNCAVVGTYEKHENMRVENGEILEYGPLTGTDHRRAIGRDRSSCIGTWLFGCTFALPLEWAIQVNGFDENMDSLGQEDTQFGSMLDANGFDIRLDKRMHVIQDRTPGECGPEMKRTSKERFQHDTQDRGHEAIRRFYGKKQASHVWNIREIRASVLAGNPFPNTDAFPKADWWDRQPIAEFA